nr:uncharacterized protein LOC111509410 [Leptinotarsa decemlineata]
MEFPNCNIPLKLVLKKIFRRCSKTRYEDSIVHICDRSDSFVYKSTKSNDIVTSQKNGETTSNNNFQIPKAGTFDVKIKLEYSKRNVEPIENKILDSGGHQTTSKSNFSTNLKNTDHTEERKLNTFQANSFAEPVETQCEAVSRKSSEDFDVKKLVELFENGILSNGNKKNIKTKKSVTFKDVDDTDISVSKLPAPLEIDNRKEMQTCSKIEGKDLENTTDIENLEHLQRNHSTTNSQKENDYSHESFHEPKVSALSNSKSSPQPRKRVADLVKIFEKPAEKLSNEKRPSLRTDLFQDACAQPSENSTILLGEKKCNKLYRSSSISNESAYKRIRNNSSQVSRSELPPVVPTVLDIAPNPPNEVQVPSVVHQIVTTKYEEAMNHIKQRKINRKQRNVHMDSCEDVSFHIKTENSNLSDSRNDFSSDLDGHRCDGKSMYAKEKVGKIDFYGTSTDSGLNQSCELLKSKPFGSLDCQGSIETTQKFNQRRKINKIRTSSDSGFDKSDDTLDSKRNSFDVLHCSETTESVEDYDQQEFLRVALGEELMNLTLSSTKSSQFDQTEYTGERSNYEISRPYSNRSFVENSISSQSLPIATISKQIIDSNSNHVVTEEGNNDTQHKETEKLMKQINIQKEILNQLSKALLLCRSQPKYVDQDIRVEAEKITLIERKATLLH